jgi:hypothetical protein
MYQGSHKSKKPNFQRDFHAISTPSAETILKTLDGWIAFRKASFVNGLRKSFSN